MPLVPFVPKYCYLKLKNVRRSKGILFTINQVIVPLKGQERLAREAEEYATAHHTDMP